MIYNFKARISAELFYNYDSFWGVYTFTTEDDIPHIKKAKTSNSMGFDISTMEEGYLAGSMQKLEIGQTYQVKAEVIKNKRYGHQYQPLVVSIEKPTTTEDAIVFVSAFCTQYQARDLINNNPTFIDDALEGQRYICKTKGCEF
jgi:hypothetical protein